MKRPVLIITGGGRGIGAETARLAGRRGYDVAVNFHTDAQSAAAVVREVEAAGGRGLAIRGDVADEADVLALFQRVDEELGPLSALVNNAGMVANQARLEEMSAKRMERVLSVNVLGPLLCAREAVKRMSTRARGQGGVIVNVSSAASRHGSPGEYVDYAASKGAIDTFTTGLAKEVARCGVRVSAVRPGIIETEIHASGGDPGRIERLRSAIPEGRAGRAQEVAHAILWLLSEEASYTTASILDVAGGR